MSSPFRQKRTSPSKLKPNPLGLALDAFVETKSCDDFMEVITEEIKKFSTPLPGIIDPKVLENLYRIQIQKWLPIAAAYFNDTVRRVIAAARGILHMVCPATGSTAILHHELEKLIRDMHENATAEFVAGVTAFVYEENDRTMQTIDPHFRDKVQTWGVITSLKALDADSMAGKNPLDVSDVLFGIVTRPRHQDLVEEIHDFTKVYYLVRFTASFNHDPFSSPVSIRNTREAQLNRIS